MFVLGTDFSVGVLAVLLCVPWRDYGSRRVAADQLLCAGAVLGACRLRHSAAKVVGRVTFAEKHNGFITFFLPD